MKIREAARQSGLTVRAVRFYQDSKLVFPEITVIRGRRLAEFSSDDVARLCLIARLRGAMLSIAQIRAMLDFPEQTADIFKTYRDELNSDFNLLKRLVERVNSIDADRLDSAKSLSDELSDAADAGVPKRCFQYKYRFDDYATDDERTEAYKVWCKKQRRRDKLSFLTDWIWSVNAKTVVAVILAILILPILWYIISNLHTTVDVDINTAGVEIEQSDTSYCEPVSVRAVGKIYKMWFKPDYFRGYITIGGYGLYRTFQGFLNEPVEIKVSMDGDIMGGNITYSDRVFGLDYRESNTRRVIKSVWFSSDGTSLATYGFDMIPDHNGAHSSSERYIIAAPSGIRADAKEKVTQIYTENKLEIWLGNLQ